MAWQRQPSAIMEVIMPGLYKVIARFELETGGPLTGPEYRVKLFDRDAISDELLGESGLGAEGVAEFLINSLDFRSVDSPAETQPDLYFLLEQNGHLVYRSPTFENVDFEVAEAVTRRQDHRTLAFGPFRISS
jgi:hypothetical protein